MGVARGWFRFWFEPSSPVDLGVSRLLFFSGVLLAYGWTDFSAWGLVAPEFWMPLPAFTLLGLHPASTGGLAILQMLWRIALVASAIGWHTRVSMWLSFVLGFYLLGLPHNFGHTFHFDATLVIAMGILACSRAGDACSVDAALDKSTHRASGDYTWPVRAVWVAMSLVFLAAGIAKLRYGGLAWIYSSNLSIVLNRAPYHVSDADPITGLGLWIAAHGWASRTMAAVTVIVEAGFVTSLFSRTARMILVPSAAAMLLGIRVLMGPTFGGFLILNVFWVPWSAILDAVSARVNVRARPAAATTTSDVSSTL